MWGRASIIISCTKDSSYFRINKLCFFFIAGKRKIVAGPKIFTAVAKCIVPTKLMDNLKNYVPHIIYHETLYSHISRWNMLQDFFTITYYINALLPPISKTNQSWRNLNLDFIVKLFISQTTNVPGFFYIWWSLLPCLQVVANKDGCIWPKAISPDK